MAGRSVEIGVIIWAPMVACMYPEGYTLSVSRCISNVSLHALLIPRECMYLDILHVFYTYPKGVHYMYTFWDTHHDIRYNKIHVSCALPWCHTGYISRYIRIRVSWTLHHDTSYDTSGYTEIQNHDTCILDAS